MRLEITSIDEYNSLPASGGIAIHGHLIDTNEFLPPPRILICSKCNDPEGYRRNCKFLYDPCRRWGNDRTSGDRKECQTCCHRCNQDHLATDFKCLFIIEYRLSLICKLKIQSSLLPPNMHVFIPKECREQGVKNNKRLYNPTSNINCYVLHNKTPQLSLSSHP